MMIKLIFCCSTDFQSVGGDVSSLMPASSELLTALNVRGVNLQTVDHGASLAAVILFLPLVHLSDQLEEGAFGHGRVPVHGPAQELELLHHAVAILRLEGKRHQRSSRVNTQKGGGVNRCRGEMRALSLDGDRQHERR